VKKEALQLKWLRQEVDVVVVGVEDVVAVLAGVVEGLLALQIAHAWPATVQLKGGVFLRHLNKE
jgi:hypothetical protein